MAETGSPHAAQSPGRHGVDSARTFLFVPGHRPERFAKAAASGADAVIVDLEDAVGAENKDSARAYAVAWLDDHPETLVRINPPGTPWFEQDLSALTSRRRPRLVMLPKASSPSLAAVAGALPAGSHLVALIETAAGVLQAASLAASSSVIRLALGNVDLGAELAVSPDDRQALLSTRSALVVASAAADRAAPIEGVTTSVDDSAQVRQDMEHAASLGFAAKLCIHPRQVSAVHEALVPSAEELRQAHRIIEAAGTGDVTVLDGRMLDRPVVIRAERIVSLAARRT